MLSDWKKTYGFSFVRVRILKEKISVLSKNFCISHKRINSRTRKWMGGKFKMSLSRQYPNISSPDVGHINIGNECSSKKKLIKKFSFIHLITGWSTNNMEMVRNNLANVIHLDTSANMDIKK